jgi:hypothetical protein
MASDNKAGKKRLLELGIALSSDEEEEEDEHIPLKNTSVDKDDKSHESEDASE